MSPWAPGPSLPTAPRSRSSKYLVPLAKGEKIGAFGLTEPNAGSDAGGTETTAVLKGDHYVLNGGKIFITNAPKADTYVVFAVTTPDIGTRGISAFIVEKGWKGFYFGDHYDKMGIRSSSTAELIFNNVKVPRENLLGKEGDGFKIAMSTLDGGRIGIASQALGIAQGAYENALDVRQGAHPVRQAHRLPAGHLLQAGRHGHQAALRPVPGLLRRRAEGAPRALRHGIRHGQDVRLRHRPGGHQRRRADLRRRRLHEGYGGGAGLPGRQDHHHLRGHQRDPAGGHRLPYPGQAPQERGRLLQPAQKARSRHRCAQEADPAGRLPRRAGGRSGGAPEEGRPRLLRGHPPGHPHRPGGAGGLRGQGHRRQEEHEAH